MGKTHSHVTKEALPEGETYLLTIDEVAARLRIGRSTAYRLCQEGRLPALTIGKAVRVPADALEDWVRRNVQRA